MGNWSKLRQLSRNELWLLCLAGAALPLVALGLRLRGFNQVHAALHSLTPAKNACRGDEQKRLQQTTRLVRVAADHGLCRANCLPRSLTLWWLLRRQGIASELRIGVSKTGERMEAHAWVEKDGTPLNDRDDVHERFSAFEQPVVQLGPEPR